MHYVYCNGRHLTLIHCIQIKLILIKLHTNNIISFILHRLNSKLVEVKLLELVKCEILTKACIEITLFLDVTPVYHIDRY
jgi:hypothetical protein